LNWVEAQKYERNWWLTSSDQHAWEQSKADLVAGFIRIDQGSPNHSIIDIGSGPFSILQRVSVKSGTALDPIDFGPLEAGYHRCGIRRLIKRAEDLSEADGHWDEAWIYNCLQHVENPEAVLDATRVVADLVRIFEWVNLEPYPGHLHKLTPERLRNGFQTWKAHLECTGKLNSSGLCGEFFVGIWEKDRLSGNVI
jgi:hypothetical protein